MLTININSFSYSNATETLVLEDLNFSLCQGEHLAILGASGCGKSTLLHLVYGLLPLKNTTIFWKGKQLLGSDYSLIPGESFMKLVSQEYKLMPFTSIFENISEHLSRNDIELDKQRANELIEVVGLTKYKDTKVKYLSGGQKQRVAIAKALAKEPEVLLLDEPFNSIDSFAKNKLRRTLFQYLKKEKITCLMATHDSEEALGFSDKLLILEKGKIAAYDTPENVFEVADTEYKASFFGDVTVFNEAPFNDGKNIYLPHQLELTTEKTKVQIQVINSYYKGSYYLIEAITNNNTEVFFKHPSTILKGSCVFIKPVL